jgi:hypothetical protein
MDASSESQLNIKLSSDCELKLIIDDCTPRRVLSQNDISSQLELVREDRERLKKSYQDLIIERKGLLRDLYNRKKIHEELNAWFSKINARMLKELEMEARVLFEVYSRKSILLKNMRRLLHSPTTKLNSKGVNFRKKSLDFESSFVKKNCIVNIISTIKSCNFNKRKNSEMRSSI